MSFDITRPNITESTDSGRLRQIHAYLYQLADQLNFALNVVDKTANEQGVVLQQIGGKLSSGGKTDEERQISFNELKALIINSADIVNAYYEKIERKLRGLYVAESDFGTYFEETSQRIEANSTGIASSFENTQKIIANTKSELQGDIADVNEKADGVKADLNDINGRIDDMDGDMSDVQTFIVEVEARIRSGLLYYDKSGIPIYGVAVGQRNIVDGEETFNKYAQFTADRLSFFDNNEMEVAYISDQKLYITHAEITDSVKIGGYKIETSNGLTFKWEKGADKQ